MERFDALVLGGGPAGCAAAIRMRQSGARVALVERDDYTRPRPGEHLAGATRAHLDSLGLSLGKASTIVHSSPGVLSHWSADRVLRPYAASGEAAGIAVVRNRFDALLFARCAEVGVRVCLRARAGPFQREKHLWRAHVVLADGRNEELTADCIIDASGRRGAFARQRGARRIAHGDLVALVARLRLHGLQGAQSLLVVEACPSGWFSLSTNIEGQAIATHFTSSSAMRAARQRALEYWRIALADARVVQRNLAAQDATFESLDVYAAFPSRLDQCFGEGWIAVGDAAATFDPLGGQGVQFAFDSAARACEALRADPSLATLGPLYQQGVTARFERHVAGLRRVYGEADAIAPDIRVGIAAA